MGDQERAHANTIVPPLMGRQDAEYIMAFEITDRKDLFYLFIYIYRAENADSPTPLFYTQKFL